MFSAQQTEEPLPKGTTGNILPGVATTTGKVRLQQDWEAQKHQERVRCRVPAKSLAQANPGSPSLGQAGRKAMLSAAPGPSPPSHTFLPRRAQIPGGSAAIWGSPSPPLHHCWELELALNPPLPSGWLCCQVCSHPWKANALQLL